MHFYVPYHVFDYCTPPTDQRCIRQYSLQICQPSQPLNYAFVILLKTWKEKMPSCFDAVKCFSYLSCFWFFRYFLLRLQALSAITLPANPENKRCMLIWCVGDTVVKGSRQSRPGMHAAMPGACDLCSIRIAFVSLLVHITQQTGCLPMTWELFLKGKMLCSNYIK